MKKITVLLAVFTAMLISATNIKAEPTEPQWVSKDVQKRNAVLEEYTGWQCTYCPDGHRIASELADNNPGKVFLVNIHAGSFAKPLPSYMGWDLTTPEGTILAAASGLTGYPAGSVNRAKTPWASNRGAWASEVNNIMSQNSPVNIFTKASIDLSTRKLIVEVELYYTESSSVSTNKLSVVLLQNEVIGAQVDGGPFNKAMHVATIDASQNVYLYRHQHALRQFITPGGAYGEDITTTAKDSYIYKKYELDIPATIIEPKIDVVLSNLEVLAFVAEGNNNIYTGHKADIEYIGTYTDLSIKDNSDYPTTMKLTPFTPKVTITNNKGIGINSFDVIFYANKEKIETKTFAGGLEVGETVEMEFSEYTFTQGGEVYFSYEVTSPMNQDGEVYDLHVGNNTDFATVIGLMEKAIVSGTLGFDGVMPENTIFVGENSGYTIAASANTPHGANGTQGAILYYLHSSWNLAGKPGYVLFGEVDFETLPNKTLSYYYAYSDGAQNGTAPKITVEVSEDWGATWTKESEVTCSQTGSPADPNKLYIPTSKTYKKVNIDLSKYANKNSLIRVAGVPGSNGNALWLDEISLTESDGTVAETKTLLTVYPNPATTTLNLDNEALLGLTYEIYDASGNLIVNSTNINNNINIENLPTGAYTLRINSENFPFIKK